jgi:Lipocalin-like domain
MVPLTVLLSCIAFVAFSCGGDTTAPTSLAGTYTLVAENDQPLPSDPSAPYGCCLTLSGSLTLTDDATYEVRTSHRNKNNGIEFDNSEQGTYSRDGNTLTFVRTGGGGEFFPYLLGPGTVSSDGRTVTLLYGDEGPGSDQTRATFQR